MPVLIEKRKELLEMVSRDPYEKLSRMYPKTVISPSVIRQAESRAEQMPLPESIRTRLSENLRIRLAKEKGEPIPDTKAAVGFSKDANTTAHDSILMESTIERLKAQMKEIKGRSSKE